MELSFHVMVGATLFVWSSWAVLFWGSIALVERHNPYNRFGWALVWGAVEVAVHVAIASLDYLGLALLLAWLVFLMRLLLGRYELGFLHALGVVIVTVVGPYFVADAFVSFVGESEALFLIALYGTPLAIGIVWRWPRAKQGEPTNLPEARATRRSRKRPPTEPARDERAPAEPVPAEAAEAADATATATAEPALAPAHVPAKPILPPAPVAPRADGEPAFLR